MFTLIIILDFYSKNGLVIFALVRPTQRGQVSGTRHGRVSYSFIIPKRGCTWA